MRYRHFLYCFLFVLLFLYGDKSVHAQSFDRVGNNVTVTPAKFELGGNPGESVTQSIKITNDDDYGALYAITVENFTKTDENGGVILGENLPDNQSQLSRWIGFNRRGGELAPHQTSIIDYIIDIPKDAPPGGAYAAIVISMDRIVRNPGESMASSRVVSIVMLTISGDIRENSSVNSFKAIRNDDGTMQFDCMIANHGNSHVRPSGSITIRNIFGKEVDKIDFSGENVLPGVTRRIETSWTPKHALFGLYTAALNSTYGQKNNVPLAASKHFLAMPWWSIILLAGIIGLVGNTIWRKRRR